MAWLEDIYGLFKFDGISWLMTVYIGWLNKQILRATDWTIHSRKVDS